MALNLANSQSILDAYSSIVDDTHGNDWLLLQYTNTWSDELSLFAYGSGGVAELKNKIDDLKQVYFAFCREQVDLKPAFLLISYIPDSVSGVKRARALVHSRRVGTIFKKHQTTLNVNSLDNLTLNSVYEALAEPQVPSSGEMGRVISKSLEARNKVLPDSINVMERRSLSEAYPPAAPVVPPITKSSSMFSDFVRRKKKPEEGFHEDEDVPPPIPPKDKGKHNVQSTAQHHNLSQDIFNHSSPAIESMFIWERQRMESLSERGVISHSNSSDEVLVEPTQYSSAHNPVVQLLPLRSKWEPEILDPVERAQRRLVAQQRRQMEEENALREETIRQAERRREKELFLKEEQEAEAQRRASLEDELRRIAIERRRKAQLEQEAEARRQRQLEERKRSDKERKLEEHERLERWRREQTRMADELAQQETEMRRREEDERRRKIKTAEAKAKRNQDVTGWVTVQTNNSLFWKRRFFKFVGTAMYFYRSPKDDHQALDTVELHGKVRAIREWKEGYEDLKAIRYSFVVEFVDGRGPWSMFADSEEAKYKLLGLLHHTAGL